MLYSKFGPPDDDKKSARLNTLSSETEDWVETVQRFPAHLRSDFDFMMRLVKEDGRALKFAAGRIKDNADIVRAAVKQNGSALQYAHSKFKEDKELLLESGAGSLEFACEALRDDRDVVLAAVEKCGLQLQFAGNKLKDHKGIVLVAVKNDGDAFEFASEALRDDEGFVLEVVRAGWGGSSFYYASRRLRKSATFTLKAIEENSFVIANASSQLKNDPQFVLSAVRQFYGCFEYTLEVMRDNFDIALAAVTRDGMELRHVSERLRDNKKIVLMAVRRFSTHNYENYRTSPLEFASERLKRDVEVVLASVHQCPHSLYNADESMKNHFDIGLAAVRESEEAFEYLSEELQNNKKIAMAYIDHGCHFLENLSDALQDDEEVVHFAIRKNASALEFASERLHNDYDTVLMAVGRNGHTLRYASDDLKDDTNIVSAAIRSSPHAFQYASEDCRNHDWLFNYAFREYANVFKYASDRIRGDRDVVVDAINRGYPEAFELTSSELQDDDFIFDLAFQKGAYSFRFASERIRSNPDIALDALDRNYSADERIMDAVPQALLNDADFVLKLVSKSGSNLRFASDELKNNYLIVKAAIENSHFRRPALNYASDNLKQNISLALLTIKRHPSHFAYLHETLKADAYLERLCIESNKFNKRSKLSRFLLKRHRDLKKASVQASVDLWLIKNGFESWIDAKRRAGRVGNV